MVRASDVFLESSAVELLGLRNFELPTVGLLEFRQAITLKEKSVVVRK